MWKLSLALLAALGSAGACIAATDQPLPAPVLDRLVVASTAGDIAEIILEFPEFAPTVLFETALLGVASPSQVIAEVPVAADQGLRISLLQAAAEAVPAEADILVTVAYQNWGEAPAVLANAAIVGAEAGGLPRELLINEALEIAAALTGLAPESATTVQQALAEGTSDPTDSAEFYASAQAAAPLETADIPEQDGFPTASAIIAPLLSPQGAPSETQNNPSPN